MPIIKSKIQTDALKHRYIFYGDPGAGKSTAAINLFESDRVVIFDTENGLKMHGGLNIWSPTENPDDRPSRWEHFEQFAREIITMKSQFDCIIIDTYWNLYQWCENFVVKESGEKDILTGSLGFGKGPKQVKKLLTNWINLFSQSNFGLVFICHSKHQQKQIHVKGKAESSINQADINLPQGAKDIIYPLSDFVFYFYQNAFGERMVKLSGSETHVAKDRTGFLPEEIPNNPLILRKLLVSSSEKMQARIEKARSGLLDSFENSAQNYINELGFGDDL